MTQKDLTTLTRYISHILDTSSNDSVGKYLHDIVDFCRINLVNELTEEELDELAEEYAEQFDFVDSKVKYDCKKDFKAGCRKIIENRYGKHI